MKNESGHPGELIDAGPLGGAIVDASHSTLLNCKSLKIKRMVLPPGKELAEHAAPANIVVQCIEGRFIFSSAAGAVELLPGQLIHLTTGELHSVKAIEHSSFLLFIFGAQ